METAKLSSKGQLVLPKSIRVQHQWGVGTCFIVEVTGEGVLLKPIKSVPETQISELFGAVKYAGPRRSVLDMEKAIAKEIKKRHASGRY
jgi:AbrB family looped-hinge helix DNA binding protein